MKSRLLLFSSLFLVLISIAHVQLNVGWDELADKWAVMMGEKRKTMHVGFLPVT
jgi:hypothetical protein